MLLKSFVIGSSVESAYYALVNDFFFIPTRKMPPMFYKKLEVPLMGLHDEKKAWSKINLMLGLLSKRLVFSDNFSIRVSDDILRIITGNTIFKYEFDELVIFDPTGVQTENDVVSAKEETYVVLDDFELSNLGPKKHELPPKRTAGPIAKDLHFYSSDRVDGSNYITDCVVESELTKEQLNSFDYSDSMVRFIVERHLTSVGIHGNLMGHYDSGKPKYRKPKVTHVKRMVFPVDNNDYKDSEKVKFVRLNLGEIIEKCTKG